MKKFLGLMVILSVCLIGIISCSSTNKTEGHTVASSENLILVNKNNPMKGNLSKGDLVVPNIKFLKKTTDEEKLMKKEASTALENLFKAAQMDNIILYGNSGYRSSETQEQIYKESERLNGSNYTKKYVARPSYSEHETGLTMDITNEQRNFHEDSSEAKWVRKNAHKYGFIVRYPKGKEKVTGYNYEPWHIRYVGSSASKEIYKKGIALEEYLQED